MLFRLMASGFMVAFLCLAVPAGGLVQSQTNLAPPTVSAQPLDASEVRVERAYSLLFRLLSTMPDGVTGQRARSYMRLMGLGNQCPTCGRESRVLGPGPGVQREPELEAFATFVDEFRRELSVLDTRAATLQRSGEPLSQAALRELRTLRQRKDTLVSRYVETLPQRLGPELARRIDEFVRLRFTPRIKYYRAAR